MDVGTHEGRPRDRDPLELRGEPGAYVQMVREARDLLVRKGYREGRDLLYVEEEGASPQRGRLGRAPAATPPIPAELEKGTVPFSRGHSRLPR